MFRYIYYILDINALKKNSQYFITAPVIIIERLERYRFRGGICRVDFRFNSYVYIIILYITLYMSCCCHCYVETSRAHHIRLLAIMLNINILAKKSYLSVHFYTYSACNTSIINTDSSFIIQSIVHSCIYDFFLYVQLLLCGKEVNDSGKNKVEV